MRHWAAMLLLLHLVAVGSAEPVRLLFDTDVGNDIDDALALAVIHALESRGECRLLAVTVTKDNPHAAPFIDAVNTFYGRPDIPVGVVRKGMTPDDGQYLKPIVDASKDGQFLAPHDLVDAPDAVTLLRQTLAQQADASVVVVQVGFSTNLARLLDSPADAIDPRPGKRLVADKCRLLSIMAGNFAASAHDKEYNVYIDADNARRLFQNWPTPIVASGFEIGRVILYPADSIMKDFAYVRRHPIAEAYKLYMKMPYDRETWDLTSVLHAVRPEHGYFGLSDPGTIRVDDANVTQFTFDPAGQHRYLTVTPDQIVRVREALIQLASQPPLSR
jgi:inosine-uridine nucleoside N-ribohydrolase